MSTKIFAEKLAASTRKAKNITTKPASNIHRSEKVTTKKSTKSVANTRKAKNITAKPVANQHRAKKVATKSTKLATTSTHKAEKIISEAIPESTSLTELADQRDLLSPADLELFWKKKYLVRIWPD